MRDILDIIFKRQRVIIFIAVWCILLVLVANYVMTPIYESEARVMIQIGREATLPPTAISQPLVVGIDRNEHINSHLQILKSRHLVEQTMHSFKPEDFERQASRPDSFIKLVRYVIKKGIDFVKFAVSKALTIVGLISPVTEEEQLVLYLQKNIDARRVPGTLVIEITFKSPNPVFAQAFLERFTKYYLQAAAISASGSTNTLDMFMEEAANISEKLRAAESELAKFRLDWKIYELETQKQKATEELTEIETNIRRTDLELNEAQRLLDQRKEDDSVDIDTNLPNNLRSDETVVELLKKLVNLKVRYSKMTADYSSANPETKNMARQIQNLKDKLAVEVEKILTNRVIMLNSKRDDLQRQQKALLERVQILDSRGIEMAVLERRVELLNKAFMQYSEKEEISRVSQVMGAKNITELALIQPPTKPIKPISPRKMLNLLLSLCVGIFLGLIYAFFREYAGGTLNRTEDMAKILGEKTIIDLPDVPELPKNYAGQLPLQVGDTQGIIESDPDETAPNP